MPLAVSHSRCRWLLLAGRNSTRLPVLTSAALVDTAFAIILHFCVHRSEEVRKSLDELDAVLSEFDDEEEDKCESIIDFLAVL